MKIPRKINLDEIFLEVGSHTPDSRFCLMELAAYIAGEPWGDHPECVSGVIGAFLRSWNDSLEDEPRQALKPYAVKCLNTAGTEADEGRRAQMAADWLVFTCTPVFLRLTKLAMGGTAPGSYSAITRSQLSDAARTAAAAVEAATAAVAWAGGLQEAAKVARGAMALAWAEVGDAVAWGISVDLEPVLRELQASTFLLLDEMIRSPQ